MASEQKLNRKVLNTVCFFDFLYHLLTWHNTNLSAVDLHNERIRLPQYYSLLYSSGHLWKWQRTFYGNVFRILFSWLVTKGWVEKALWRVIRYSLSIWRVSMPYLSQPCRSPPPLPAPTTPPLLSSLPSDMQQDLKTKQHCLHSRAIIQIVDLR